jgi:hypothetical protein
MSERYPLPTVYGPDSMEIAFTDAQHCYATYTREGVQRINQVEYRGNAHLFLWADGRWHIGRETDTPCERHNQLFLNRVEWTNYNKSHASESARAKFASEVELAVNNFAVSNLGIITDAQREHLQDKLEAAEHAYAELVAKADEARAERDKAQAAVDAFRQAVTA